MKIKLKAVRIGIFASLLAASASFSLANAAQEDVNAKGSKDNEEVIGIVGEKPLSYFRLQMERAELDFYDAFNAIADEEKFKVKCRRESLTGSNIKKTACYPQYVLDRFAQETQDALSSGAPYPTLKDVEFMVTKEKEESQEYVEKIVMDNPDLLKKLIVLNEKQTQYESQRSSK